MNSTCDHPAFKCKRYCKTCYGFIPTKNCSPYSEASPELYLPCSSVIPTNQPGFCLCGNGKIEKRVGCYHEPFTCIDVCLESITRRCSKLKTEPISTSQGGECSGLFRVHNSLNEGMFISLLVLPPEIEHSIGGMGALTVQTITGVCRGGNFIFRGSEDKRLIKQFIYDGSITDIELTDCYVANKWFNDPYTYEYNNNNIINFSLKYGEMLSKSSELKYTRPLNMEYYLYLNQSFAEIDHDYEWSRTITCPVCHGTTRHIHDKNIQTCSRCNGTGEEIIKFQLSNGTELINHILCKDCNGYGIIPTEYSGKCEYCNGTGYVEDIVKGRIRIPTGIHNNDYKLIFKGKGEIKPFYYDQDVIFHIKYYEEKNYTRDGDYNIRITIPISLKEALNGFNRSVTTLLNQTIFIGRSTFTLNNEEMILIGEGLPIPNDEIIENNNTNNATTSFSQSSSSCYNFVVTKPYTAILGCDELIPNGVEGYCNCTYKLSPVSTINYYNDITCKYVGYCGNNYRGNLTLRFRVK